MRINNKYLFKLKLKFSKKKYKFDPSIENSTANSAMDIFVVQILPSSTKVYSQSKKRIVN